MQAGEACLIIGLGIMGQLHVALARQADAGQFIGTDFVAYRREKALSARGRPSSLIPPKGDIVEQLREHTKGEMAEVVIVGPGSVEAMELGLRV